VTGRLQKFAETLRCDHMVLFWALPLVTFAEYRRSLVMFAERVMPRF
jgi:hypothetical protein